MNYVNVFFFSFFRLQLLYAELTDKSHSDTQIYAHTVISDCVFHGNIKLKH